MNGADYADTGGLEFRDFYGVLWAAAFVLFVVFPLVYAYARSVSRHDREHPRDQHRTTGNCPIGTCSWCGHDVYPQDDFVGGANARSALFHARCRMEMIVVVDP